MAGGLLLPVVPDVLDVVVVLHDVDELLHHLDLVLVLQLLETEATIKSLYIHCPLGAGIVNC